MEQYSILKMDLSHLDAVEEIENDNFSSPWSRKELENEIIQNKMGIYIVLTQEDRVLGYAGMWHIVNEGHITNIAVKREHQGKGLGNLLVESLIKEAILKEMIGITLEVRISNLKAQRLYTNTVLNQKVLERIIIMTQKKMQSLCGNIYSQCGHRVSF